MKNNIVMKPRQLARWKPTRGREPPTDKLSSLSSSLFPYRLSVTDGETTRTFTYHADGQLARATCAGTNRTSEDFLWDGLALVRRGDEQFVNEPHVGGGNPVASSKGVSYFNDALGTTVGSKKDGKYSAAALTAFGERLDSADGTSPAIRSLGEGWFTGKPYVEGLGHAFLMRNYRAGLAKWQTADPMGYPDGWNQLAYCGNNAMGIDICGMAQVDYTRKWTNFEFVQYYYDSYLNRLYGDIFDTDCMKLTTDIWNVIFFDVLPRVEQQIDQKVVGLVRNKGLLSGNDTTKYITYNSYDFKPACWALGDGTVSTVSQIEYSWGSDEETGVLYYIWTATVFISYSDTFMDPLDIGLESPFSRAFSYYHEWSNVPLASGGVIE